MLDSHVGYVEVQTAQHRLWPRPPPPSASPHDPLSPLSASPHDPLSPLSASPHDPLSDVCPLHLKLAPTPGHFPEKQPLRAPSGTNLLPL